MQPPPGFGAIFLDLPRRYKVSGALTTDAQLAALALDHGAPLVSADAGFARFNEIDWVDPFQR